MGKVKGQHDYDRFKKGEKLTRQESIDAQCYICSGMESADCKCALSCTLYQWSPYKPAEPRDKAASQEKAAHLAKYRYQGGTSTKKTPEIP